MDKYENKFMIEALAEAKKAFDKGEVPVGAVIVRRGEVIARGHNLVETTNDPTAHAEMIALKEASSKLENTRLTDCAMYVTVEPCSMCAGALVWARIDRLYIGTMDKKAGGCGSVFDIVDSPKLNHRIVVEAGIMENECTELMKSFFKELRI